MKWIASFLFVALLALAVFAHAPSAQAGVRGGPVATPTPNTSATPLSA